jgi:hypothetical protein
MVMNRKNHGIALLIDASLFLDNRCRTMPTIYIASYHAASPTQSSPHPEYNAAIKKQVWPYDYGEEQLVPGELLIRA